MYVPAKPVTVDFTVQDKVHQFLLHCMLTAVYFVDKKQNLMTGRQQIVNFFQFVVHCIYGRFFARCGGRVRLSEKVFNQGQAADFPFFQQVAVDRYQFIAVLPCRFDGQGGFADARLADEERYLTGGQNEFHAF